MGREEGEECGACGRWGRQGSGRRKEEIARTGPGRGDVCSAGVASCSFEAKLHVCLQDVAAPRVRGVGTGGGNIRTADQSARVHDCAVGRQGAAGRDGTRWGGGERKK
jgi:hypothetical protein